MTKPSAKDWRNLPIEKWNTTTFHAYLTDQNSERFGASYVPFGQGSLSAKWQFEKGSLKNAIAKYGAVVIKEFIDACLKEYRSTADYPALTWGFAWSYRRNVLSRVLYQLQQEQDRQARKTQTETMTIDDMLDLL